MPRTGWIFTNGLPCPGHPIKEVAASLSRVPEVVVADSPEIIETDIPRISAHIGDGFVHGLMMALMQSSVKDGAGRQSWA